ncbi:MAG: RES family NAD+ phosphorylase [Acidimicrobiia bacterium]
MSSHRPFELELLDAIEGADIGPWQGTAWRQVFEGTPPLRPNQRGARWNPQDTEALYCALDPLTASAEIDYLVSRQSIPITRPRVTYELGVGLERVADLSTDAALQTVGLSIDAIRANGIDECRHIGSACAWLGFDGILVPSARNDGINLVVFVTNLGPDNAVEIVAQDPPSSSGYSQD